MQTKQYRNLLVEILTQLEEKNFTEQIDKPLEYAAAKFEFSDDDSLTFEKFLNCCGKFVQHITEHGGGINRLLSRQQSIIEAIKCIEESYNYQQRDRLDYAFLDARQYGLSHVFMNMISSIKQKKRNNKLSFIIKNEILPLQWIEKVRLTRIIFHDWNDSLPEELKSVQPNHYANQLPELLITLSTINQQVLTYTQTRSKLY